MKVITLDGLKTFLSKLKTDLGNGTIVPKDATNANSSRFVVDAGNTNNDLEVAYGGTGLTKDTALHFAAWGNSEHTGADKTLRDLSAAEAGKFIGKVNDSSHADAADKVWTQSHNGSWYINSNWDGTYFQTNTRDADGNTNPINVERANNAGNADTVDGLHVHAGTNNEANKIVRTDGNGYIQAGWINTTSGTHDFTPDKIYCSNDNYIRYKAPADIKVGDSSHADNATNAGHADNATNAGHADSADNATNANYATTAGSANSVAWTNITGTDNVLTTSSVSSGTETLVSEQSVTLATVGGVAIKAKLPKIETGMKGTFSSGVLTITL